jgi:phenylalanyl-tRNA synthetase alpha chain
MSVNKTQFPDIETLTAAALRDLAAARTDAEVEEVRRKYLGRKGDLHRLRSAIGRQPADQRQAFGQAVNTSVEQVESALTARRTELADAALQERLVDELFDPTLPGQPQSDLGTLHPLTLVQQRIEDIFKSMGFYVLDYPEADSEYFNFDALNIPPTHPAREMQDTFWLENGALLRTHTSAGQVRAMRQFGAPVRAIFPGRVFRYETTDASHEHTFHQVEGLYVDRKVSVANLIATLQTLLSEVLERQVSIRLRPGYFPFVEPGFELDVQCLVCGGVGCPVCKYSSWVELVPCGLVHPAVLAAGGLDPNEWQGWAFGLGLSRIVMMKYRIEDIRALLGGDMRFLKQFTTAGIR